MQADHTKLVIHTGAGPENDGKERRAFPTANVRRARPRGRNTRADSAGALTILGADGDAAGVDKNALRKVRAKRHERSDAAKKHAASNTVTIWSAGGAAQPREYRRNFSATPQARQRSDASAGRGDRSGAANSTLSSAARARLFFVRRSKVPGEDTSNADAVRLEGTRNALVSDGVSKNKSDRIVSGADNARSSTSARTFSNATFSKKTDENAPAANDGQPRRAWAMRRGEPRAALPGEDARNTANGASNTAQMRQQRAYLSGTDAATLDAAENAAHGQSAEAVRSRASRRTFDRAARRGAMARPAKKRRKDTRTRLRFGERLLRNSAVACALLLALLAAKNIDTPWTRAAVEGVERALTMRIDLDESLGRLSFVRELMPESMLVFFDLSNESELAVPVDGELDKRYDEQRPWIEFACEPGADVVAAEAGTVLAVTQLSGGGWGVLIEHADGLETVSAYLLEPVVQAGQSVERGQVIARSEAGRLYFEARRSGVLTDPAELLGL